MNHYQHTTRVYLLLKINSKQGGFAIISVAGGLVIAVEAQNDTQKERFPFTGRFLFGIDGLSCRGHNPAFQPLHIIKEKKNN